MEKRTNNSSIDPNSLKEANKTFKKGESSLKTGLFKWSPDYLEASLHFEKAAKQYKVLGAKPQAVEAYLKWSSCFEKLNENYGTAEGLVEAAFLESDRQKSIEYLH